MTREKALKTLELQENFTEEELRKNYRKLSRLHHPDNYMQAPESVRLEHEETMKEVNAAYDYFTKFNIDNYRIEIINRMHKYYVNPTIGDMSLIMDVKRAVNESESLAYYRNSQAGVDSAFADFLAKLKKIYESYKTKFYQENYIDGIDVKEEINYNLRVEDFYIQLCRIKDKYSRKAKFEKRLEEEIAPYKLYATCTEKLWILITTICVNNAKHKAEASDYRKLDDAVEAMHKEIRGIFELVDKIKKLFNIIGQEEINDTALIEEYVNLKHRYDRGDALSDIENGLKKLSQKIEEYKKEQKRKEQMKQDEPMVNALYVKVLSNYNNILISLNPVNDNDKIKEITEFFQIIMNLFIRYSIGLIDLDRLLMLNEISFIDMIKDKELLNSIIEGKAISRLKIYLKRKPFCNLISDDNCFFVLREENGKYFIRKILVSSINEQEISINRVEREYISLLEVMKSAIYQGYTSLYLNAIEVQNLYEINVDGDYRYITLDRGKIGIASYGTLSDSIAPCSDDYKNKEYFMNALQEQIQEFLDRDKSR